MDDRLNMSIGNREIYDELVKLRHDVLTNFNEHTKLESKVESNTTEIARLKVIITNMKIKLYSSAGVLGIIGGVVGKFLL